ncbi:hypothetical protein [Brachybacterium hainanense]|uniref:Uncharacterized protein n=1 Tax=Brachybacterium hainanense TaxID=1541174 RepID=A0ABV6RAK4_9MICO
MSATSATSIRTRLVHGLAVAAVLGITMAPVGALASPISDKVGDGSTVEAQKIQGICEIAPRLPFICVG